MSCFEKPSVLNFQEKTHYIHYMILLFDQGVNPQKNFILLSEEKKLNIKNGILVFSLFFIFLCEIKGQSSDNHQS